MLASSCNENGNAGEKEATSNQIVGPDSITKLPPPPNTTPAKKTEYKAKFEQKHNMTLDWM
jgi:hypothetical protein